MTRNRRFQIGALAMLLGTIATGFENFTAFYVGLVYVALGLIAIIWDYIPDNEELFEEFKEVEWMLSLMFKNVESEEAAVMRTFGFVMTVLTALGWLFHPLLIDSWGLWGTGIPGAYLIVMSHRKWIEEYVLPIPLR